MRIAAIGGMFAVSSQWLFAAPRAKDVCVPIQTQSLNKALIIKNQTASSTTYLIENISSQSLWLNRLQAADPHANAGWASQLQPHHWSALSLSMKKFAFTCATNNTRKINNVDCKKVLRICKSHSHKSRGEGNYWLVENKLWPDLMKALRLRQ